jgi:hypothetical protein
VGEVDGCTCVWPPGGEGDGEDGDGEDGDGEDRDAVGFAVSQPVTTRTVAVEAAASSTKSRRDRRTLSLSISTAYTSGSCSACSSSDMCMSTPSHVWSFSCRVPVALLLNGDPDGSMAEAPHRRGQATARALTPLFQRAS